MACEIIGFVKKFELNILTNSKISMGFVFSSRPLPFHFLLVEF